MKNILTILFVLLISQSVFAQTEAYKYAEFDVNGVGCDNFFRYDDFVREIKKNDSNRGLVVIYTGNTKDRFGNVLAYTRGAKAGIEGWLRFPSERVSIIVLDGRSFFAQEFWVIPKDAKLPYSESPNFDWSKLDGKFYFAHTCLSCEPSYPQFTDFQVDYQKFSDILKTYPDYNGQIIVNNYDELSQIKKILTKRNKLPRNRYSIQIRKQKKEEESSISVDLYLIPNKK